MHAVYAPERRSATVPSHREKLGSFLPPCDDREYFELNGSLERLGFLKSIRGLEKQLGGWRCAGGWDCATDRRCVGHGRGHENLLWDFELPKPIIIGRVSAQWQDDRVLRLQASGMLELFLIFPTAFPRKVPSTKCSRSKGSRFRYSRQKHQANTCSTPRMRNIGRTKFRIWGTGCRLGRRRNP